MSKQIEIMAPVGSFESLMAAINAGANSVYFGIEQLNMRARSSVNFTNEDLKEIVRRCDEHSVKTYLALNTIMYDHDITLMHKICDTAKESGVTAIILSDIAALQYARSIGLEVHMSVQTNVTNIEAVKFYSSYADVIVLARELTLQQIAEICRQIDEQDIRGPSGERVKIEVFAHGALCVAVSGKCYMSLATYNASANRGACLQNCRRKYRVVDDETGDELVIDNEYVMSPKDLNTIAFLDKLIDAGVSVFKLEGRGRKADYVHTVVTCYREAADAVLAGTYTKDKIDAWNEKLATVYNRGFWEGGYYMGKKLGEWSGVYGSKATKEKKLIGVCTNYYAKSGVGLFEIRGGEVKVGDEMLVTGTTTGVLDFPLESMLIEGREEDKVAKQGDMVTIKVPEKVRINDKLFVVTTRSEN
ncbi:U32 family peptidase [Candidatus Woesearchaeota archaeon]|nr:U32 family peptidase [Candidatus Woesearchaeota archaeon]